LLGALAFMIVNLLADFVQSATDVRYRAAAIDPKP
jgi:hypothetical protein